jgi:hypothetical protein
VSHGRDRLLGDERDRIEPARNLRRDRDQTYVITGEPFAE